MQAEKVFKAQQEWQETHQSNEAAAADISTFIQITVNSSEFLLPIKEVKEISEMPMLRPYPARTSGHVGVANIRGNVIPVLSMACFFQSMELHDECKHGCRLVVLTDEAGEVFGVLAGAVKKVSVAVPQQGSDNTVRLNEKPMRLISYADILKGWGATYASDQE